MSAVEKVCGFFSGSRRTSKESRTWWHLGCECGPHSCPLAGEQLVAQMLLATLLIPMDRRGRRT